MLEKAGFVKWRQKGSHLTMYRARDHRALTVPIHLLTIIRNAGLSVEGFLR